MIPVQQCDARFAPIAAMLYLWLWGAVWIAMALLVQFSRPARVRFLSLVDFSGHASVLRDRGFPEQPRFVCRSTSASSARWRAILGFGILWPIVLGGAGHSPNDIRTFAFICLLVMQIYVLAGIWFDNYLLFIGLLVSALILIGLLFFADIFWLWFAAFCGGPVFLSGFVVRYAVALSRSREDERTRHCHSSARAASYHGCALRAGDFGAG